MERLKKERLVIQEQTRQIQNENTGHKDQINEEQAIIEKFEREIEQLRCINYRRNDDNLDLLQ